MLEKKFAFKAISIRNGFLYCFIQLLSLIPALCLELLIDRGLSGEETTITITSVVLLIATPFVSILLSIYVSYKNVLFAKTRANEVSMEIFERILSQDVSYFDDKDSAELAALCSKESSSYIYFHIAEKPRLFAFIVSATVSLILIGFSYWCVVPFLLLYIPLSLLPSKNFAKRIEPEVKEVVEINAEMQQKKTEDFHSVEFIKTNLLTNTKKEELESSVGRGLAHWGKIAAIDSLSSLWNTGFLPMFFVGTSLALTILFHFVDVPGQKASIGSLASLFAYATAYCAHVNSITGLNYSKAKHKAEMERLTSFLCLPLEKELDSQTMCVIKNSFGLKKVDFSYRDDVPVLQDFNLDVPVGKWTVLLGKSGIGKSTILSLLLGLRTPQKGSVYFDGKEIDVIGKNQIRKQIAYVCQSPFFYSGSIRYNFGLFTKNNDLISQALKSFSLSELIEKLPDGLDTNIGEAAKLLSGGEKQRLALAMQYCRQCDIWFLDEAVSHLDVESKKVILSYFKEAVSEGKTVLMVTHDKTEALHADFVIQL